jgi:hypothetical protein
MQTITASTILHLATTAGNCSDYYCGSLLAHNVLRTLGRWSEAIEHKPPHINWNPPWFVSNQARWVAEWIPAIERNLLPLQMKKYVLDEQVQSPI